jgi:hypothetical protein
MEAGVRRDGIGAEATVAIPGLAVPLRGVDAAVALAATLAVAPPLEGSQAEGGDEDIDGGAGPDNGIHGPGTARILDGQ